MATPKATLLISLGLSSLLCGTACTTAHAAGLKLRPSIHTTSLSVEPYAGESFGFQSATVSSRVNGLSQSADIPGFAGGLLAGVNVHLANSPVVMGLELNAQIAETRGETTSTHLTGTKDDLLWDAALRARLGYKIPTRFGTLMPFAAAGIAIAEHHKHSYPEFFGKGSTHTLTGWTAGGGIDVDAPNPTNIKAFDNMKLRLEYAYASFGEQTFQIASHAVASSVETHNLRVALIKSSTASTPSARASNTSTTSFNGIYAGLTAAAQLTSATTTNINHISADADATIPTFGLFYGLHMPLKSAVIGVEGDMTLSLGDDADFTTNGAFPAQTFRDLWSARARLMLGYPIKTLMPYITAGIEYGQVEQALTSGVWTSVEARHGITAGVGISMKMSNNIFARTEYLYAAFPEKSLSLLSTPYETDVETHSLRVGLGRYF